MIDKNELVDLCVNDETNPLYNEFQEEILFIDDVKLNHNIGDDRNDYITIFTPSYYIDWVEKNTRKIQKFVKWLNKKTEGEFESLTHIYLNSVACGYVGVDSVNRKNESTKTYEVLLTDNEYRKVREILN